MKSGVKYTASRFDDVRVVAGKVLESPAGKLVTKAASGYGCVSGGRKIVQGKASGVDYATTALSCGTFIATK
jgi:hypothetical protein